MYYGLTPGLAGFLGGEREEGLLLGLNGVRDRRGLLEPRRGDLERRGLLLLL